MATSTRLSSEGYYGQLSALPDLFQLNVSKNPLRTNECSEPALGTMFVRSGSRDILSALSSNFFNVSTCTPDHSSSLNSLFGFSIAITDK